MTTRVRIGGEHLDRVATVSDLVDSTILRTEGWSGDYQASCKFMADRDFSAPWFRRGADWETIEEGVVTWGGLLSEPSWTGDGWSLSGYGYGSASDWPAIDNSVGLVPSSNPDAVLDYATALTPPLPIERWDTSIGAGDLGLEPGEITDIATLLDRQGKALGQFWWVDSFREISWVSLPTVPTLMLTPGSGYMGTADDNYASHRYGLRVSSLDPTTGQPDGWALNLVEDEEAWAQFGVRKAVSDLKGMGLLTGAAADDVIVGEFAINGGRMDYTNAIELTETNLLRPGFGWCSPMSARAGEMCRIPDVWDTRTNPTVGSSIDFPLGEVTRYHATQRATAKPLGYQGRNHKAAMIAAQPKQQTVVRV